MKLTLSRKDAFTLCGLLVGIGLLLAGVVVVVVLVRLISIPPRELPPEVRDEVMDLYPNYTNYTSAPWPVYHAPVSMFDYLPEDPLAEKVLFANAFHVEQATNMVDWQPIFVWCWSGRYSTFSSMFPALPMIQDFELFHYDGFDYQMKPDWSGIEITPSPGSTNKSMFWRTTAYD